MTWRTARGTALAVMVWLGLLASPVQGRDLVVGVEAIDYSPVYGWRDNHFIGAGREILDAFAAARGYRLIYRAFPVKRLLAELIHGGVDLKFPDSPDWQAAMRRGQPLVYSVPVIAYVDGTLVRADHRGRGVEAVRVLGTVAGFTPFAWQSRLAEGKADLRENPSFEALLRQVTTGRIDGAYVNVAVAAAVATRIESDAGSVVFDPALPHIRDSYRLSSRTAPEVVAEFNTWLTANGGVVAEIIARTQAEAGVSARQ